MHSLPPVPIFAKAEYDDVLKMLTFDTMQAALASMKYTDVKINFRLTTN
jgi:hypothetical protein